MYSVKVKRDAFCTTHCKMTRKYQKSECTMFSLKVQPHKTRLLTESQLSKTHFLHNQATRKKILGRNNDNLTIKNFFVNKLPGARATLRSGSGRHSHVEYVCVKLSRVNFYLRKLKAFVKPYFLLTVYYRISEHFYVDNLHILIKFC